MTVEVIRMQGGAVRNPLNGAYFADDFQRADQPFFVGDKWYSPMYTGISNGATGAQVEAWVNVGGAPGQLNLTTTAGSGKVGLLLMPVPMDYYQVSTHSQFAEMKLIADNSVGANFANNGPMVACQPNTDVAAIRTVCYSLLTFMQGVFPANVGLYLGNDSSTSTLLAGGAAIGGIALNDTLRVEVDFGVASNTVRVYINSVLRVTVTDNNAARPTFGMPGICFPFTSNGITQSWQNFKCGTLPQKSTLANYP
jgi:hypothetical protein